MAPLRCLVAPQNTFIQKIEKQCNANDSGFLVTNARILDNPIIFVNNQFVVLSGFSRSELFQRSAVFTEMHGRLTNKDSIKKWTGLLENNFLGEVEILLYKKSGDPAWFLLKTCPVRNDKDSTILNIIIANDITAAKKPIPSENGGVSMNKLARLAFSVKKTKSFRNSKSTVTDNETDITAATNTSISLKKDEDTNDNFNIDHDITSTKNIKTDNDQIDTSLDHLDTKNVDNNICNGKITTNDNNNSSLNERKNEEINNGKNSIKSDKETNATKIGNKRSSIKNDNLKKTNHEKKRQIKSGIGRSFGILKSSTFYKSVSSGLLKKFCENKVASANPSAPSFPSINHIEENHAESQGNSSQAETGSRLHNCENNVKKLNFRYAFFSKYDHSKNFSGCKGLGDIKGGDLFYYKQEAPITPPHIILHYSLFKSVWDWLILAFTLLTCVITPYTLSFYDRLRKDVTLLTIQTIVDVFFMVDTYLNFYVTFPGTSGQVISDPCIIKKTYLTTWFFLDLLASLPYDVFSIFTSSDNVFFIITSCSIARLLRTVRVGRHIYTYVDYGVSVLVFLILLFVLIAHWFSCIWYMIGVTDLQANITYGWMWKLSVEVDSLFVLTNVTYTHSELQMSSTKFWTGGPSDLLMYTTSLFYTLSSMTTIGFGNVAPTTEAEKMFTIFMMVFGSLLYATIFGNVTTIFQQMYSSTEKYHEMLSNVKRFMKYHQVPLSLTERILDYVVATWTVTKGINTEKVLSYCPQDMKADVCIHLNRSIFLEQPAFRLASESCLRSLAIHLKLSNWAPGDILFHKGQSLESLCFVGSGTLEVTQDGEIVAFLGAGDSLGDLFWKESTLGQCKADVKALTYCNIHIIKRDELLEVLNFYTPFAHSFERNLKLSYNLRRRLVFRKILDVIKEKELSSRKYQTIDSSNTTDHTVRRMFSKFKKLNMSEHASESLQNGCRKKSMVGEKNDKDDVSYDNEAFEEDSNKAHKHIGESTKEASFCAENSEIKKLRFRSKQFESFEEKVFKNTSRKCSTNVESINVESINAVPMVGKEVQVDSTTASSTQPKEHVCVYSSSDLTCLRNLCNYVSTLDANIQLIMNKLAHISIPNNTIEAMKLMEGVKLPTTETPTPSFSTNSPSISSTNVATTTTATPPVNTSRNYPTVVNDDVPGNNDTKQYNVTNFNAIKSNKKTKSKFPFNENISKNIVKTQNKKPTQPKPTAQTRVAKSNFSSNENIEKSSAYNIFPKSKTHRPKSDHSNKDVSVSSSLNYTDTSSSTNTKTSTNTTTPTITTTPTNTTIPTNSISFTDNSMVDTTEVTNNTQNYIENTNATDANNATTTNTTTAADSMLVTYQENHTEKSDQQV